MTKSTLDSQRWGIQPRERIFFLVLGDFFIAALALFGTLFIWASQSSEYLEPSITFLLTRPPLWFFLLPLVWVFLLIESYDINRAGSFRSTLSGIITGALIGFLLYAVVYFFPAEPRSLPRLGVPVFLSLSALLTLLWRSAQIWLFSRGAFMRRVLVIGGGSAGQTLFAMLEQLEQPPFSVVGVLDDDPEKHGQELCGHLVLGSAERMLELAQRENVSDIIVAISGELNENTFQVLLTAQEMGFEITRMQTLYEDLIGRVPIFHHEADWVLRSFIEQIRVGIIYRVTKRLIDIFGGLVGFIVFLAVLPFVVLLNIIESGFPILYTQTRAGKGDQPYEVIKFRTMRQDAEQDGKARWAVENDQRVTRVGRLLRKTHIDELPQCINVLKGEMSLIGPRPERPELMSFFQSKIPFYRARLLVKPGITGWAQIHQRYASSVDETNIKLEYDLYYIKHRSWVLDLLILLRTPGMMLGLRGR